MRIIVNPLKLLQKFKGRSNQRDSARSTADLSNPYIQVPLPSASKQARDPLFNFRWFTNSIQSCKESGLVKKLGLLAVPVVVATPFVPINSSGETLTHLANQKISDYHLSQTAPYSCPELAVKKLGVNELPSFKSSKLIITQQVSTPQDLNPQKATEELVQAEREKGYYFTSTKAITPKQQIEGKITFNTSKGKIVVDLTRELTPYDSESSVQQLEGDLGRQGVRLTYQDNQKVNAQIIQCLQNAFDKSDQESINKLVAEFHDKNRGVTLKAFNGRSLQGTDYKTASAGSESNTTNKSWLPLSEANAQINRQVNQDIVLKAFNDYKSAKESVEVHLTHYYGSFSSGSESPRFTIPAGLTKDEFSVMISKLVTDAQINLATEVAEEQPENFEKALYLASYATLTLNFSDTDTAKLEQGFSEIKIPATALTRKQISDIRKIQAQRFKNICPSGLLKEYQFGANSRCYKSGNENSENFQHLGYLGVYSPEPEPGQKLAMQRIFNVIYGAGIKSKSLVSS